MVYVEGYRVIAVDPSIIPLGSIVEFSWGGKVRKFIAADTGGDIKGNRIDILVESRGLAYEYGRLKDVEVKIVGKINL